VRTPNYARQAADRGGRHPYGYMSEKRKDGYFLVPNPETKPTFEEIVGRVISGEPLTAVTRDLNMRVIPCPWGARNKETAESPRAGPATASATATTELEERDAERDLDDDRHLLAQRQDDGARNRVRRCLRAGLGGSGSSPTSRRRTGAGSTPSAARAGS
jgi:hypothetical protein